MTSASDTASHQTPLSEIPYPGLEPFNEDDHDYFFGRDRDRKSITSNLEASRLTLLYGASGVGKSSVLLAGVVSTLRRQVAANAEARTDRDEPARFAVAVQRTWIGEPLTELMEQIRQSALAALGGKEELAPWVAGEDVVPVLRAWTERVKFLYVVLDQFEEYFLYRGPSDEPGSFEVEFVRIINDPRLRVHFLISLREDALALLDRFKAKIPRLFDNYLRIDHLDHESARAAIKGPVDRYNEIHRTTIVVEPALVDALLDAKELRSSRTLGADAPVPLAEVDGGKPRVETPYLQLILRRLWRTEAEKRSGVLSKETLDGLKGPKAIVDAHLADAMGALSQAKQDLAVAMFRYLVMPSTKSKIALTAADLAVVTAQPEGEVATLLGELCEGNRILRRILPPPAPEGAPQAGARYELFHDVLAEPILEWRARKVAEREEREEREGREAAEREEREAAELELRRRLEAEEREKLEAQREWEKAQEQARKDRIRLLIAIAAFLIALVAIGVGGFFWLDAREARDAEWSQRWATAAVAGLAVDPDRSVRNALIALEKPETPEAAAALRTSVSQSRLRAKFDAGGWATAASIGGPGGEYVAYGTGSGVRLWNWREKREAKRLTWGADAEITTFAGKGRYLLGAGLSGAAVWDLEACMAQKKPACATAHAWEDASTAAISPDGHWVVTASDDVAQLHELTCDKKCRTGPPLDAGAGISELAVNEAGAVAAATSDGTVLVWEQPSIDRRPTRLLAPPWGAAFSVALSSPRPGELFLAVTGDKTLRVWDLRRCSDRSSCEAVLVVEHPDWVNTVAFSRDGHRLATAAEDGVVRVFERTRSTPVLELRGHRDTVFGVGFDPTGSYVVSGSADGSVRVWDVRPGSILRGNAKATLSATFSKGDGDLVATAGSDGTARIFDRSGKQLAVLLVAAPASVLTPAERKRVKTPLAAVGPSRSPTPWVWVVDFSPDGEQLVTSDDRGYVRLWNVAECRRLSACAGGRSVGRKPTADTDSANAARFSPRGKLIVVADNSEGLHLVDAASGAVKWSDFPEQILAAHFNSTGQYVLASSATGVSIWDVGRCYQAQPKCEPRRAGSIYHGAVVRDLAFSPGSDRIVTGGLDWIARIWKWSGKGDAKPKPIELSGHTGPINSVRFDASGTRVVTSSVDGTVRVWDAATGDVLAVIGGYANAVTTAEFAPRTSAVILSGSEDGTARILRCETCGPLDELIEEAERREKAIDRKPMPLPGPDG